MPFAFLTGKVKQRDRAELPSESWSEFEKRNGRERKKTHRMSSKKKQLEARWKNRMERRRQNNNRMRKKDMNSMWHQKLMKLRKRPIERRQFAGQTVNLPRMKIDFSTKENNRRKSRGTKHKERKYSREIDFFLDLSKFLFCWRCASLIRLSDKIECRNGKRVYHIPSRDRIRNTIEIKKMKLKIMVTITKYSMLGVRSHKTLS